MTDEILLKRPILAEAPTPVTHFDDDLAGDPLDDLVPVTVSVQLRLVVQRRRLLVVSLGRLRRPQRVVLGHGGDPTVLPPGGDPDNPLRSARGRLTFT